MATLRLQMAWPKGSRREISDFAIGFVTDIYPAGRRTIPEGVATSLRNRIVPFTGSNRSLKIAVPAGKYVIETKNPLGGITFTTVRVRKTDVEPKKIQVDIRAVSAVERRRHQLRDSGRGSLEVQPTQEPAIERFTVTTDVNSRQSWAEIIPEVHFRSYAAFVGATVRRTMRISYGLHHDFYPQDSLERLRYSSFIDQEETEAPIRREIPRTNLHGHTGVVRRYLRANVGGQSSLCVLPTPWKTSSTEAEISVSVQRSPCADDAPDIFVSVNDIGVQTLLGYLSSGNIPAAASILLEAKGFLYHKRLSRFAAAAGAYVLLESWRGSGMEDETWHRWVENLSKWFEDLPDGLIIRAWIELKKVRGTEIPEGKIGEFRSLLLEAFQRGIPFYTFGLKLLADGLSILLESNPVMMRRDRQVVETYAMVHWFALRADRSKVFTTIRFDDASTRG